MPVAHGSIIIYLKFYHTDTKEAQFFISEKKKEKKKIKSLFYMLISMKKSNRYQN